MDAKKVIDLGIKIKNALMYAEKLEREIREEGVILDASSECIEIKTWSAKDFMDTYNSIKELSSWYKINVSQPTNVIYIEVDFIAIGTPIVLMYSYYNPQRNKHWERFNKSGNIVLHQ